MGTSDAPEKEPLQLMLATLSELQQITNDIARTGQHGNNGSETSPQTNRVSGTDSLNAFLREIDELIDGTPTATLAHPVPANSATQEPATSPLPPAHTAFVDKSVEERAHTPSHSDGEVAPKEDSSEQTPSSSSRLPSTSRGRSTRLWQLRRVWLGICLGAGTLAVAILILRADPKSTRPVAPITSSPLQSPATKSLDAAAANSQSSGPRLISAVRSWSSSDGTHVEIYLDGPVKYAVHRIPNPDRIYFDFSNTLIAPSLKGKTESALVSQVLAKIRVAERKPEGARVTLVTRSACDYSAQLLPHPYRLMITLREQGTP